MPRGPATHRLATGNAYSLRLPEVTIPSFGGHLRDWPHFRAVVEKTLVRLTAVSESQRYSALLNALRGEPHQVIASTVVVDHPFSAARELLVERYALPRVLCSFYMDVLLDLPTVASLDPRLLQQLASSCREFVQVLRVQEAMEQEIELSSKFVARLVLHRLPTSLRQRFEEGYSVSRVPGLEHVLEFIRNFCPAAAPCREASAL